MPFHGVADAVKLGLRGGRPTVSYPSVVVRSAGFSTHVGQALGCRGSLLDSRIDSVNRYSAIRTFFINELRAPRDRHHRPSIASFHSSASALKSRRSQAQRSQQFFDSVPRPTPSTPAPAPAPAPPPPSEVPSENTVDAQPPPPETLHEAETPPPQEAIAPPPPAPPPLPPPPPEPHYLSSYPSYLRRLARSVPHIHLRPPSLDDILSAATGFWQRLRIRLRWLTIRSFRRYNTEDYSTFFSWFVISQTVWLLLGTTTFVGAIFWTLNSLRLQHYVASAISNYLTSETGFSIVFQSAIVPKWRHATISFKNVYVSQKPDPDSPETSNRMTINLDIDSIDVTLSLWRWIDGKGLVKSAVVRGVRGVVDRRSLNWDPSIYYNPAAFRHAPIPGSFQLDSLQLEDALVTVYQSSTFRPYFVSIFKADVGTLRRQWLFYDLMSAESIVGQFDNCLFSLHKPQRVSRTREHETKDEGWKRMSRFRIDGVNIDHIKAGVSLDSGPLSWIQSGKVDAVLDIRFPIHPDEEGVDIGQLISSITAELTDSSDRLPGQRELARPALYVPDDEAAAVQETAEDAASPKMLRKVEIDIDLRFRDVKAAVPLWNEDLSYVNNALIRPIVAFINANRTLLPIRCKIVKNLNEFDGCWTLWETGLMDETAAKTYDALAYHVTHTATRNIRAASLWSLQMTANAVLGALKNALDRSGEGLLNLQLGAMLPA